VGRTGEGERKFSGREGKKKKAPAAGGEKKKKKRRERKGGRDKHLKLIFLGRGCKGTNPRKKDEALVIKERAVKKKSRARLGEWKSGGNPRKGNKKGKFLELASGHTQEQKTDWLGK